MAKSDKKTNKAGASKLTGIRKKLSSPMVTVALFAVAAGLLLFSTIGGTRAALTYVSDNYIAEMQTYNIGVTLNENGSPVANRDYGEIADGKWSGNYQGVLLENLLPVDEKGIVEEFRPGKIYTESLSVTNSGQIDEYVRVSIYKYWLDKDGNKTQELSPELIQLNLINVGTDAEWVEDEDAKTTERTVLYHRAILPAGADTAPFSDTLTVDAEVASKVKEEVSEEGGYTTITTTYAYNGYQFVIEAEVDAVQTHSAADAVWSAWGRRVTIGEGGILSLAGSSVDRVQNGDVDSGSGESGDEGGDTQSESQEQEG